MFNLDAGAGRIRGIYTEGLSAARPILQSWLEPVRDLGASTVSGRKNTSSDHEPFRDAGIPAFSFITDPLDYPMRTWHTNMDVYDRLQPDDSRQASIVTSVVLFQAANLAACSDLGSVAKN
jgi:Zn-dependent M28 family amino/carboxypeptidase